jgi:hypothetical protein
MAFSTTGSSESILLASRRRLDGLKLASPLGEICIRRFQKKHSSTRPLRLLWYVREVVRGMSFPLHFHIEEMRVIEYLLVEHLFAFRLPETEARVQATIDCVVRANDSVPDHMLKLLSKHWCARLRMLTSFKRVQVSCNAQRSSLTL